ncbi:CLM5 protein, partial [Casuarius casuarius]|nr:CLM5 protein [Casuarius casuarius]
LRLPPPSPLVVFAGLRAQTPGAEESLQEGSTLSVQCLYTPQAPFPSQKAWCRVNNGICKILAKTTYSTFNTYVNQATEGRVTIEDDVKHGAISITMKNLQVQDSGTYSCASQSDTNTLWQLKTISLNVFKELHRQELDSLSVQCPYNAQTPSTTPKAWCRRQGPTSCNTVVSTNYPSTWHYTEQSRTSIWDNTWGKTVTVTMEKLQQQDSGVYWCVLYTQTHHTRIMEVRLTVSKTSTETTLSVTATTSQTTPSANDASFTTTAPSSVNIFILLSVVLGILLILALISITLYIKKHRRGNRQAEDIYEKPEDTAQFQSTERMGSPRNDSNDLKYVTLHFTTPLSPEDPLYANVGPSQAPKTPKAETVEYADIALK